MDSKTFAKEMAGKVADFCHAYDGKPPAYSYVPLTTDEQRIKIMQARLWNEVRAAEVLGAWLKTTPAFEVKENLAEAIHEEFEHAELLSSALRSVGATPYDYEPVPAQVAMFNAFESQTGMVERMAAFPLAGEGVAVYMMDLSLKSGTVPEWVRKPYQAIREDEAEHGGYPQQVLAKYATDDEIQANVRRAVAMSLVLRREYFDSLDRWVLEGKDW